MRMHSSTAFARMVVPLKSQSLHNKYHKQRTFLKNLKTIFNYDVLKGNLNVIVLSSVIQVFYFIWVVWSSFEFSCVLTLTTFLLGWNPLMVKVHG